MLRWWQTRQRRIAHSLSFLSTSTRTRGEVPCGSRNWQWHFSDEIGMSRLSPASLHTPMSIATRLDYHISIITKG